MHLKIPLLSQVLKLSNSKPNCIVSALRADWCNLFDKEVNS
jgi:hypothetical protein